MNRKAIIENPSRARFVLRIIAAGEAMIGLSLLGWALFELQRIGWSFAVKPIPGSDAHLVIIGMLYLALGSGGSLVVAAGGIMWAKRWPFAFHTPLVAFCVYVLILAGS